MTSHLHWTAVCAIDEIVPDTGVCALVNGLQVAIFHVAGRGGQLFAIDNYDPHACVAVLSRGLVGNLGERTVVASPLYKHHFDLETGQCLEMPEHAVRVFPVRTAEGKVWICA
ncbi:nitrite reductase small subunit NirD [Imbroritus primus]|jgi:nitrite reductase (NADH) small subunit|uniref:nitrite reductase small subunit NirD n=1 Tax=Imbroritus primus TaxID=3058603 RepID=UPI003D161EC5